MESLLPDVDKAALTGDYAEFMHAAMTSGLRHNADGWLDDDLAFVAGWGFEVADVSVPLLIAQGEQDLMVPLAHGTWLAKCVPAATVWIDAEEGHLSLHAKVSEVHEWLVGQS
jgi:pimeloyl-ACP methyl ester carboxylesterase